jgi:hypothetical protein
MNGMLSAPFRSSDHFSGMPQSVGKTSMCATLFGLILRLVISVDLVGEQVGLTRKRSNAVPAARSLSMFGVFSQGCPCAPTGAYPWSSVITRMMFGAFPKAAPARNNRNNANFITWTALVIHRARDKSFFLFDPPGDLSNIVSY